MRKTLKLFACTLLLVSAISCGGRKGDQEIFLESQGLELEPNVDLVAWIEGKPEPEQVFDRQAGIIDFEVKALDVDPGSKLKLEIELVQGDGGRVDITSSEHVKLFTTFYKVHECGERNLCVWPEPSSQQGKVDTLRYGRARIEAEFITPNGEVGFNGFYVNVIRPK